jgi:fumarate reductase flavoprotein subunit
MENEFGSDDVLEKQAENSLNKALSIIDGKRNESVADIRNEMGDAMEEGIGIYRDEESIKATIEKLTALKERYKNIKVTDSSTIFNTDWLTAIELGFLLGNAEAMAYSALNRKESRGSHQRLDYVERNDEQFLKHSLATYNPDGAPSISYSSVKITKSQPAKRVYGKAAEYAEQAKKAALAANK